MIASNDSDLERDTRLPIDFYAFQNIQSINIYYLLWLDQIGEMAQFGLELVSYLKSSE